MDSETGHPEFYLPSDWLSEWSFTGVRVLDQRKLHRPPCMVYSCSCQELDRPHQSTGEPGLSHIMVRLMMSGNDCCSWFKDKTKPQMCLTPSPDYFYSWYWYDRILRLWYSHSWFRFSSYGWLKTDIKDYSIAVTTMTTKWLVLPMNNKQSIWNRGLFVLLEEVWQLPFFKIVEPKRKQDKMVRKRAD